MIIKLKKNKVFPPYERNCDKSGLCRVVMSADISLGPAPGNNRRASPEVPSDYTIFAEPEVFESLPATTYSVWIFFPTGDCVSLPVATVRSLFDIYPDNHMTEVIYGE